MWVIKSDTTSKQESPFCVIDFIPMFQQVYAEGEGEKKLQNITIHVKGIMV